MWLLGKDGVYSMFGEKRERNVETTVLFIIYAARLVVRTLLFLAAVALFVLRPEQLDFRHPLQSPLSHLFVFIVLALFLIDYATKLTTRSKIAVGSLKQYKSFQIPTQNTTGKTSRELREYFQQLVASEKERLAHYHFHPGKAARTKLAEARTLLRQGTVDAIAGAKRTLRDVDVLRLLPFTDEDLDISQEMRSRLRFRRYGEILGVVLFWIFFNATIALALYVFGWLNYATCMVWSLAYFLFDMICVVLWCPLQILFMRNRCCTTCQIFNWDGIMTVTPLLFVPSWYSFITVGIALIILLRWEVAAFVYPERFFEETNASLSCANCHDKLCKLRPPILEPLAPSSRRTWEKQPKE